MPDVPSGFTHFPTIMLIAERLSESLVAFVKFGHSRSRSGPLPGHSRGTESRNQEDLGGPGRTRSRQQSNTSGHLRSREDTGGHVTNTVRDREAPGSNPGPPTNQLNSNFPDRARTWPEFGWPHGFQPCAIDLD